MLSMTNVQSFSCERVRLNLNVRSTHTVDEAGLSYIGVACEQYSSFIGVYGRQSSHMLSNFLEIGE